jgi:hypothetical protein
MTTKKPQKRPRSGPKPNPGAGPHHIADEPVTETDSPDAGVRSPITETGLPVEEQIRKEWDPKRKGGLPTSLTNVPR